MPLIKDILKVRSEDQRSSPRDREDLIEQLESNDANVRRRAAGDLSEHPETVGVLVFHLSTEPTRAVREAIFSSLLHIGSAESHDALAAMLRSEDAEIRNSAIEILKTQMEAVKPLIERMVTDIDPDVRIFAVSVMGALPCNDVPAWLARIVENDLQINVCCAAIEMLAEVGELDSIPSLESMIRFGDQPYITFAVRSAIASIRSRCA